MTFLLKIPEVVIKGVKLKENEVVNWTEKKLTETLEEEIKLDIVSELAINPKDVFKFLKVNLADLVSEGQIIAEKKTLFSEKKILSPCKGEIRSINHIDGQITLISEKKQEIPFVLKATFVKKEKGELVFKAEEGIEMNTMFPLKNTLGGLVSYISSENEVNFETIQDKIVVSDLDSDIIFSKILAFDPKALVLVRAIKNHDDTPVIQLLQKAEIAELMRKKLPLCLYLENSKIIYFYK